MKLAEMQMLQWAGWDLWVSSARQPLKNTNQVISAICQCQPLTIFCISCLNGHFELSGSGANTSVMISCSSAAACGCFSIFPIASPWLGSKSQEDICLAWLYKSQKRAVSLRFCFLTQPATAEIELYSQGEGDGSSCAWVTLGQFGSGVHAEESDLVHLHLIVDSV